MHIFRLTIAAIALMVLAAGARAQDGGGDSLDLTMKLLPEGAVSPEAITKTIALPPAASATGVANSENGRARANEAREARETGRENAAEAQERGREFGQEIAEQARENRDNAGRGNSPDRPDRPDLPGPANPPGPPTP
jgi:hypothetical protein